MRSQLCDKVRLGCGRSPRQVDRDLFPSAVITTATELVKIWPAAVPGGGLMSYYRLTIEGYRAASLDSTEAPPRTSLQEIAPSRFRHAMATADAIVQTLAACRERGVKVQPAMGMVDCPSIRPYGTRNRVFGHEAMQPASGDPRTSNGAVFRTLGRPMSVTSIFNSVNSLIEPAA